MQAVGPVAVAAVVVVVVVAVAVRKQSMTFLESSSLALFAWAPEPLGCGRQRGAEMCFFVVAKISLNCLSHLDTFGK